MIVFDQAAPPDAVRDPAFYARMAVEGMAHASRMNGERYDMSDRFDPAWSVPIMSWCVGGAEHYELQDGREIRLRPGAVLLMRPGERYAYQAETGAPLFSRTLAFPRDLVDAAARRGLDDMRRVEVTSLFSTARFYPSDVLASLLDRMARDIERGERDADTLTDLAALILSRVRDELDRRRDAENDLACAKPSTRAEIARRVARAVDQVHAEYARADLSVGELAATACLSRFHFVRNFTHLLGTPPSRYLSDVRMRAATGLLDCTDAPIGQIARDVGYANRSAFQRRFHKRFGETPARRRARIRA